MGVLKNIRKKKMNAQGGRCYYCDLPMWDDATARVSHEHCKKTMPLKALRCTAEHLHPRSEGGMNSTDNIVAACLYCNNQRHRRREVVLRLRVRTAQTAEEPNEESHKQAIAYIGIEDDEE